MSSNAGLTPDGTPNQSYQQKLNYYSTPRTPPPPPTRTSSSATTIARNIGYNRPPQQPQPVPPPHMAYSPYYSTQPPSSQPQQPPPQQPPPPGAYQQHPQFSYPPGPHHSTYQNPPPLPQQQSEYYAHHQQQPPASYSQTPLPPHISQSPYPQQQQQQPYSHHSSHATYIPQQQQQLPPPQQQHQSSLQPPQQGAATAPLPPIGQAPGMTSYFQPSGRRKALLVGINYRGTSAELRGCVRDVTFVHHLLTTKFGFRSADFVVLTDEATGISGVRRGAPTRRTILDSLRWLVADTRPGDSLWFSFSGHGSQVRDVSGDEDDGYDETILPVDYRKSGHIIDDELYDIVRRICRGARLTVLLDACHSGTGLDLPYQHDVFGTGSGQRISGPGRPSITQGLMGVAGALLSGNASGALSAGLSLAGRKKKQHTGPDPNSGEVLLFSGCKDNQTSADTSKLSGGLTTGAMTYALIETLEHSTVGDWRNYTYRKLLQTMRQKLRANRMTQTPQFSTSHPFDLGSLFVV